MRAIITELNLAVSDYVVTGCYFLLGFWMSVVLTQTGCECWSLIVAIECPDWFLTECLTCSLFNPCVIENVGREEVGMLTALTPDVAACDFSILPQW